MPKDELTLQVLRSAEHISSQKSLAKELGYSVGKINYVIKALVEAKDFRAPLTNQKTYIEIKIKFSLKNS